MSNCNPACQKIIINTGFMAPLARLFAETVSGGHPLRSLYVPALRLSRTADTATEVFAHALATGALVKTGDANFTGCEQASALVSWIEDATERPSWTAAEVNDVAGLMEAWSGDLHAAIVSLVSGR